MREVLYPRYRSYVESRIEVNDAMMALLAGSRLAGHTLLLTTGSDATLSELFPAVEHINRFDLRSDVARKLLTNADHYLASVAIPYALAVHEAFVTSTLSWLEKEQFQLVREGQTIASASRARPWNMHDILFQTLEEYPPEEWMQSFHVLREARNCIIHAGGVVSDRLRDAIETMSPNARIGWANLNLQASPEQIEEDGHLRLTTEHVFTAFATIKRLDREINGLLQRNLSETVWARTAVEDFASNTSKLPNSSSWQRSLIGYVALHNRGCSWFLNPPVWRRLRMM